MNRIDHYLRAKLEFDTDGNTGAPSVESFSKFEQPELVCLLSHDHDRGICDVLDEIEAYCREHICEKHISIDVDGAGDSVQLLRAIGAVDLNSHSSWVCLLLQYVLKLKIQYELALTLGRQKTKFGFDMFNLGWMVEKVRSESIMPLAVSGYKLKARGKAGGRSKKRTERIKIRDDELRQLAKEQLSAGRTYSDVVIDIYSNHRNKKQYPKSMRQYRSILKVLKRP